MSEEEIIRLLRIDKNFRIRLTTESFYWFFLVYFTHYTKLPIAPFQKEIINLLQNNKDNLFVFVAFRGSAKSTIITLTYVIWCLVTARRKYPLILSLNQQRVQQALFNIRLEFEKNELLIQDYGPFFKMTDEWSYNSLYFSYLEARITAISTGEGFRGLRERQFRPDLIIADDIEDVQSTQSEEARTKLWQTINAELIPAGDLGTKIIFLGNLVHDDSALVRLKKLILSKKLKGIYTEYPLYDDDKNIFWPGKFPTWKDVVKFRASTPDQEYFQREYLLKIIPQGNRVIEEKWISFYDQTKQIEDKDFRYYIVSVDPAVSIEKSSDKTAITVAAVYGYNEKVKAYILPNPVNKRMEMPQIIEEVKRIKETLGRSLVKVIVEGGSTQKGIPQLLKANGIDAQEYNISGQDKRTRLSMCGPLIKNGTVLFAKSGNEELIHQILYLGVERYDDLVDSFSMLVSLVLEEISRPKFQYAFIGGTDNYRSRNIMDFDDDDD